MTTHIGVINPKLVQPEIERQSAAANLEIDERSRKGGLLGVPLHLLRRRLEFGTIGEDLVMNIHVRLHRIRKSHTVSHGEVREVIRAAMQLGEHADRFTKWEGGKEAAAVCLAFGQKRRRNT